ncbi:MAG TPA: MlaD family protein [Solirubrobacteraceae bacterium]|nr:MlaD family protein [Solirubrobacteraceae bacterium]
MRRLLAVGAVLVLAAALAGPVFGSGGSQGSNGRFDVIFDDARGLVGGQLVKVAGARAGSIVNVVVTSDFKARIEATVDSRFLPFHQDATCTIRPEGLIAENYVECDPGTSGSPVLQATANHPPTVPVTRTTEPVSLLDLFNTFNLSTRQRLTVLIDELGIATAGRGEDINQILLRANPTLGTARRVIAVLDRQLGQLRTILDAGNRIAAEGASHTGVVQTFLDRAASFSQLGAAHSGSLSAAIARLPGLLAASQPALRQLDAVAVNGTPLLQELQAAAPALNRVSADLGPFVQVAKPGLARLSSALQKAIPAIRTSTPLIDAITNYARKSEPSTLLAAQLYKNLQRHGFAENFLGVFYYVAASLARFDSTSHILPLLLVAPQNGACGQYATSPVPGCSAHYGSQPHYTPERPKALQSLTDYLVK